MILNKNALVEGRLKESTPTNWTQLYIFVLSVNFKKVRLNPLLSDQDFKTALKAEEGKNISIKIREVTFCNGKKDVCGGGRGWKGEHDRNKRNTNLPARDLR